MQASLVSALTSATSTSLQVVESDTPDIQRRLPAMQKGISGMASVSLAWRRGGNCGLATPLLRYLWPLPVLPALVSPRPANNTDNYIQFGHTL